MSSNHGAFHVYESVDDGESVVYIDGPGGAYGSWVRMPMKDFTDMIRSHVKMGYLDDEDTTRPGG